MQEIDTGSHHLSFDLNLPALGPYKIAYDRSGRYCVLGGAKGHLALIDSPRYHMLCEVQVKERTHDVCMLHNDLFFAAAQKKYVYIYDRTGAEVHCCREHSEPTVLEFLPHHFLLVSAGKSGMVLTSELAIYSSIIHMH